MDEGPQLYTRDEVCKRLRISRWTLYDLATSGELRPTRVRSKMLYSAEELNRYIREHTDSPTIDTSEGDSSNG